MRDLLIPSFRYDCFCHCRKIERAHELTALMIATTAVMHDALRDAGFEQVRNIGWVPCGPDLDRLYGRLELERQRARAPLAAEMADLQNQAVDLDIWGQFILDEQTYWTEYPELLAAWDRRAKGVPHDA